MAVRILRVFEVPDLHAREGIRGLRVVQFEVDGHGPFHVEVAREEWSVPVVLERIRTMATSVRSLVGSL